MTDITIHQKGQAISCKISRRKGHRFTLKISPVNGLECFCPHSASLDSVNAFIQEKKAWIDKKMDMLIQAEQYRQHGQHLPDSINLRYVSQEVTIQHVLAHRAPRVQASDNHLIIHSPNEIETQRSLLRQWIKQKAQCHFSPDFAMLARNHGFHYTALSIGHAKQRWGSCRADNAIRLNPLLLFLPKPLAEHVMLHELSHTQHHDHSKAFWSLLGSVDHQTPIYKKQLRDTAYCYQFIPAFLWS